MSLRLLARAFLVGLPLVILSACNRPDLVAANSTPTLPPTLSLEEIETAVVETLKAEAAGSVPSETPITPSVTPRETTETPTPSPTPTPTSTNLPTATHTQVPSNTPVPPTATYTPKPTDTPRPTDTPKPTDTPEPTDTPKPTITPCPKFTNAFLRAVVNTGSNAVSLTWGSSGGCGPYTGMLTARYQKESNPYETYEVKGQTGKLTETPPSRCEGQFTVLYTLKLNDSSGQSVTANTSAQVIWIC